MVLYLTTKFIMVCRPAFYIFVRNYSNLETGILERLFESEITSKDVIEVKLLKWKSDHGKSIVLNLNI